MKLVKNLVFAVFLVSAIAVNTSAGIQDTPGSKPPDPPPSAMSIPDEDPTISNTEPMGGVTAETSGYLFYEALAALLSMY